MQPPQTPGEGESIPCGDAASVRPPSPRELLRLARGFSCAFWGLLFSFFLLVQGSRFRMLLGIPLPPYVIGLLPLYVGVLLFHSAGGLAPEWTPRVRHVMGVLLLQAYLAPFMYWWQRRPTHAYFGVHFLAFLLSSVVLLTLLNRLAEALSRSLKDPVFRAEAGIAAWAVNLILLLPCVAAATYACVGAWRLKADPYTVLLYLYGRLSSRVVLLLLVPFAATLAVAWKAKEVCLRRLTGDGAARLRT